MVMLKRLRVMAAAIETTPGTAETLDAGDGVFNAYDVELDGEMELEEREAQGSFDRLSSVVGEHTGSMKFKTDMWWDGTITMPAWASVLLPMCAWPETSQVYAPKSEPPGTSVKTGTLGVYKFESTASNKCVLHTLKGAVGSARIVMPTGKMAYIEWTFQGVWVTPSTTTAIAPTYPTDAPIRYANATTSWNSVALCVSEIVLDQGNVITPVRCAAAEGISYYIVSDRKPVFSADPESVLLATQNRYSQWTAGTEAALSIVLDGPSDSTITLAAPKAQIQDLKHGDRDGFNIDQLVWSCNKNGANIDGDVTLTFAEAT